jgi:hypothetical protein
VPTIDERLTVLEAKVEKMDNDARDHFSELREFIVDQVTPLKTGLSAVHQRLDRIDKRLDGHGERFDRIDWKLDQVLLILARR